MEVLAALIALAILILPFVGLFVALNARRKLREMQERLGRLELTTALLEGRLRPSREASPPAPVPVPPPPPVPASPVPETASEEVSAPWVQPPAAPRIDWRRWESLLGGTWLNRVGALVLVLGIGFFLRYAFDNRWIGPAGRVTLGVVAGVAFLLLGERLQRAAYRVPAQGVVAAGIATLYLSAYAAHSFYQLVTRPTAFAFMVLVTATGLALALHHEARAIAILANLGGFLTPVLLSADRDAGIALFTYLAVLDGGMLAAAYWRRWPELPAISFVFTHSLYWTWFNTWYHQGPAAPQRAVALGGATAFFALFALLAPVETAGRRFALRLDRLWHPTALLLLAAPSLYFVAARAVLYPELRLWLSLICLILAGFYTAVGRWATATPAGTAHLALFHWAIALAFLTLTLPVQFAERGTAIAWSVEGAAIVWGGFRLGSRLLRLGGLAVLTLAGARWLTLVLEWVPHPGAFAVDHPAFPATVVFALATAVAALVYRAHEREVEGKERYARPILAIAATLSVAVFLHRELAGHRALGLSAGVESVVTTLVWLAAGVSLLALAPSDPTRTLLGATTLLLVGVGLRALILDTDRWRTVAAAFTPPGLNLRFAAGLLIAAVYALYAQRAGVLPFPRERRSLARAFAGGIAAFFLLCHLSAEILLMPLERVAPGELTMARHMGLSVLWTIYAFATMGVGIRRRQPPLRFGALGLFALTVVKVFLVDLSWLDAGYRVLSFVILGGLLIGASFLYTKYRERILGDTL